VVLGIRPEHFHLRPIDGNADMSAAVKMHLNVIEPLGNDMDVYMHTHLHDHVVGRVEAQAGLQRDLEQTMFVDLRKIHFFEPGETGMNLSLKSEPAHALA
jgi:ABC-type sugar transport system ATPase subunit